MIHHLEINDRQVPPKLLGQWKTLFVQGYPQNKAYAVPIQQERLVLMPELPSAPESEATAAATLEAQLLEGLETLDDTEFLSYLEGSGDWTYSRFVYHENEIVDSS